MALPFPYFKHLLFTLLLMSSLGVWAQNNPNSLNLGNVSGSFQSDVQWYFEDSVINAETVDEELASNTP